MKKNNKSESQRKVDAVVQDKENKNVEKALKESEILYRMLVENSLVGVLRSNINGEIIYVNDAIIKMLGFDSRKDLISMGAFMRYKDPQQRKELAGILRKDGQVNGFEANILTKDGKEKVLLYSLVLNGDIIDGTLIDITDRKEADEKIRQLNNELESVVKQRTSQLQDTLELNQKLIDSSSLGVFACREDGPAIIANPTIARISGTTVDQMLKLNFRELDSWKKNGLLQKVETALKTRKEQNAEIHLTTTFGRDAWIFYYITTFISGGKLHFLMMVEDVTVRKLAEFKLKGYQENLEDLIRERTDELVRSRELLVEAQTMAHLGSWEFDIVNDEISGSEEFYRLFGVAKEQIAHYEQFEGLLHTDDKERVRKDVEESIEKKKPYNTDYRIMLSDNKIRYINARGLVSLNYAGEPQYMKGTCLDITERKQMEEALRESKTRYDLAMQFSKDGLYDWNLVTNEIYYSPGWKKMVGYEDEELINDFSVWELLTEPEDVKKTMEMVNELIEKKRDRFELDFKMKHKQGHWVDVLSRANAIFDEKGKAIRIVGTHVDITERKQADNKIRDNEKRFRELIESLPQLFWTCRIDGPCDYLSKQWVEYTGVPETEQLGYRWLEQLHPDDRERTVTEWMEKVITGGSFDVEFRIRRNDGVYHWFKTTAVPMHDPEGNIIKWFGSNTDFDEIKKAEEQLINFSKDLEQKVEERTKELEAFSYSVSHDLRAPLRHVSGYVELLNKHFQKELSEKGQHYLSSIADSVHLMGKLIDDLLRFSRTGRVEMVRSVIDMNGIIQEVKESISRDNPARNIEWIIGKLPPVYGDSSMLNLVWLNLLNNAVKFTGARANAKIEIGVIEEKKEWIFYIKDNGVGFDMQYAHKLFGVFQRLHPTEEYEGTGIGLANVRRIVLRHGGRTWAEAEPDKGATFNFSLPK